MKVTHVSKPVVILGTGSFGELVKFYLDYDSDFTVVAFAQSRKQMTRDEFNGLPVVAFEEIEKEYPPNDFALFIAVGYTSLNKIRERLFWEAKRMGYDCISYVSSKATIWDGGTTLGENVFIFEDNTIQPFTDIGDGTILWSGNHLGHHSSVGNHCFVTSHVVISGHCQIGNRCMLGVNATLSDGVKLAQDTFVGPNALVQKPTKNEDAYLAERTKAFAKPSTFFFN